MMMASGTRSPAVHDLLGLQAELGAGGELRAQHVAGRDVGDAALRADPGRLRALPRAGRAHEDQVEHRAVATCRKPLYARIESCDSIWRMVSIATPTTISTDVPPSARATVGIEVRVLDEQCRRHRDDRQEQRAGDGQPHQHLLQVHRRGPPRSDAGDEAAVLLEVVRLLDRVEHDRHVEEREGEDEHALAEDERPRTGS